MCVESLWSEHPLTQFFSFLLYFFQNNYHPIIISNIISLLCLFSSVSVIMNKVKKKIKQIKKIAPLNVPIVFPSPFTFTTPISIRVLTSLVLWQMTDTQATTLTAKSVECMPFG
jgi:hypothetical protein